MNKQGIFIIVLCVALISVITFGSYFYGQNQSLRKSYMSLVVEGSRSDLRWQGHIQIKNTIIGKYEKLLTCQDSKEKLLLVKMIMQLEKVIEFQKQAYKENWPFEEQGEKWTVFVGNQEAEYEALKAKLGVAPEVQKN